MTKILIERADGGVSILHLIEIDADKLLEDVVAAEVEKWKSSAPPSQLPIAGYIAMKEGDLPADRTFRDAWIHDGGGRCVVNMDKARSIHLDRIRTARDVALQALDGPALRAMESKDPTEIAAVTAKKETLRDIPQTVDLTKAATPDELKAIWPAELAPARAATK